MGTVISLFNEAVNKFSDKIAIEYEGTDIKYAELKDRSNELRDFILANFVSDNYIGTLMPSSIHFVTALLAIYQSKNIHVPLDYSFSFDRMNQIGEELQLNIIITSEEYLKQTFDFIKDNTFTEYIISIGNDFSLCIYKRSELIHWNKIASKQHEIVVPELNEEDSAYVYYTSGSTGKGKAILGKHGSLLHFISWEIKLLKSTGNYKFSQVPPVTFDASLKDILPAICSGSCVSIPSFDTKQNTALLAKWIIEKEINILSVVPSIFRVLTNEFGFEKQVERISLKYVLLAGEMLFAKDVQRWRNLMGESIQLINLYGATESTILKTYHFINEKSEDLTERILIGKPIDDTFIIILKDNKLANIGMIGEIYIKTKHLTKGYIDKSLNTNAFIQNPLNLETDILYKTGDLGRYTANREVELLGRIDNQIKLNGVRIELAEIEMALLKLENINESVATVYIDNDNQSELIAYYTGIKTDEVLIKEKLGRYLNNYLIPSRIINLDEFPKNLNGKVDRKNLPSHFDFIESEEDIVYDNEYQEKLAKIWQEILVNKKYNKNQNFFTSGGSSLKAILMVSRIFREFNVNLKISDIFQLQTIEKIAAKIWESSENLGVKMVKVEEKDYYELSFAQKRLWLISKFENSSNAYNMHYVFKINDSVDFDVFKKVIYHCIEKYEIFRSLFFEIDGEPKQKIIPFSEISLEKLPIKKVSINEDLNFYIENKVDESFDLATWPYFMFELIENDTPGVSYLHFNFHHIIFDGWSSNLLFDELWENYKQIISGNQLVAPAEMFQYKDYINWQNQLFDSSIGENLRLYWKNKLEDIIPRVEFSFQKRRPKKRSFIGKSIVKDLDPGVSKLLSDYCAANNTTDFIGLTSMVNVFLNIFSGNEKIIFGTPVAGRNAIELEKQMGLFVNLLPLINIVKVNNSFDELFQEVNTNTIKDLENQDYPLDKMAELVNYARDSSRQLLFDFLVVFQNFENNTSTDTDVTALNFDWKQSKYDFVIIFSKDENGFVINFNYSTDLYSHEWMDYLMICFHKLIKLLIENPKKPIGQIKTLLSSDNRINKNLNSYIFKETILDSFSKVLNVYPTNIAVKCSDKSLTYNDLNEASDSVSYGLCNDHNIKKGDRITVCMDNSSDAVVVYMAVLKIGAVFIPIDVEAPLIRNENIIKDCDSKITIVGNNKEYGFSNEISLDKIKLTKNKFQQEKLNGSDLAYIIYTSGSTGNPKGVLVNHQNVSSLLSENFKEYLKVGMNWSLYHKLNFDFSVWEIWGPLTTGGTIVIPNKTARIDINKFVDFLIDEKINLLSQVPPFFYTLIPLLISKKEQLSINTVVFGGAELTLFLLKDIKKQMPHVKIVNMYGITETTVHVTSKEILESDIRDNLSNIGKPISTLDILIVDEQLNLVPDGTIGEICVKGFGVSKGYLNQALLTKEKFIELEDGFTLYRSGDFGYRSLSQDIIFKGRRDEQIEIRGYRIEKGEIIAKILDIHDVVDVAILIKGELNKEDQIWAFYKLRNAKSKTAIEIKDLLKKQLPNYMIPSVLIELDELPRTKNDKINYNQLRDFLPSKNNLIEYAENAESLEFIKYVRDLLNNDSVVFEDNFFEVGGHSILAMRLINLIKSRYNSQLDFYEIFDFDSIREIFNAVLSRINLNKEQNSIENENPLIFPVTDLQKEMWLHEKFKSADELSLPAVIEWDEEVNEEVFKKAIEFLLVRHEMLRANFFTDENNELQHLISQDVRLDKSYEFQCITEEVYDIEDKINSIRNKEAKIKFDFNDSVLFKCILVRIDKKKHFVLIKTHHIIYDGWSLEIILKEVKEIYNALLYGKAIELASLKGSFRSYSNQQNHKVNSNEGLIAKRYWLDVFDGYQGNFNEKRATIGAKSLKEDFFISKEIKSDLEKFCKQEKITKFMVIHTALRLLMLEIWGISDSSIGSPFSNRETEESQDVVGCFMNVLAFRSIIKHDETIVSLLDKIKETITKGVKYGYISMNSIERDLSAYDKISLFDIGFTLHNHMEAGSSNLMEKFSEESKMFDEKFAFGIHKLMWWNVFEGNDVDLVSIFYKENVFEQTEIDKIHKSFMKSLKHILYNKNCRIDDLITSKDKIKYSELKLNF
ncbi:amino acid adenylation domain-containing protein [Flavobacterium sp.]|uniref:amino acid adenylation domain-containing protein n=1 Tax=Flavobacterium sp. TaxID=239 RepID=UPI003D14225E